MSDPPPYRVRFYRSERGERDVLEFMAALPDDESVACEQAIQRLREYGPRVLENQTWAKRLRGRIWELRPKRNRRLFARQPDGAFLILVAAKKDQRVLSTEVFERAEWRLHDYEARYGAR
ncbi:MAG: type II toxin-antitoxin system RelE/ParE family toxin [Chloroflexi bacterium]|nr:type II toxin-antitoxin system RelE/ParE family toxin [Chloroflexota bacterium]